MRRACSLLNFGSLRYPTTESGGSAIGFPTDSTATILYSPLVPSNNRQREIRHPERAPGRIVFGPLQPEDLP